MTRSVSTALLLPVASHASAQDTSAAARAHAVYVELLGSGRPFSINSYPDEGFLPSLGFSLGARF